VKERLGGKLKIIVSGGAPLAASVEEFLRVVTCTHVVQGYGMHLSMFQKKIISTVLKHVWK
jgi:long-subunit acyl-CoA synthetase (AMP-forming)